MSTFGEGYNPRDGMTDEEAVRLMDTIYEEVRGKTPEGVVAEMMAEAEAKALPNTESTRG